MYANSFSGLCVSQVFLHLLLFASFCSCEWPSKIKRHTVIARLLNPVNMGSTSQEVSFVILVVASNKEVRILASLFTFAENVTNNAKKYTTCFNSNLGCLRNVYKNKNYIRREKDAGYLFCNEF